MKGMKHEQRQLKHNSITNRERVESLQLWEVMRVLQETNVTIRAAVFSNFWGRASWMLGS